MQRHDRLEKPMNKKFEGVNIHNETSKKINDGIKRVSKPSLSTIRKWKEEWMETGNDKKMTFGEYKKNKTKEWYKQK